jgi:hypothetical protein
MLDVNQQPLRRVNPKNYGIDLKFNKQSIPLTLSIAGHDIELPIHQAVYKLEVRN